MRKSELSRVRKAWPWLIVLALVLAGMAYLILSHIGSYVSSSAVIELDKDLISTNRLKRTSKALRKTALASFLFFALSLSDAIGNLPDPLSSPSSTFSLATTFVLPVALMVGGLTRLMTALIMIASE